MQQAREVLLDNLETYCGEPTSRLLLERVGVDDVDSVVNTTTAEIVNIKIARIQHDHFNIPHVLAIDITQDGIRQIAGFDCEVEGIFKVSATGLRNSLEQRTKTVHGIGLGKKEILAVEVHPHSAWPINRLAASSCARGRPGSSIVMVRSSFPKGDTRLKPRDRLVVIGDPNVVQTVADLLTFRFTRFPLKHGDTLVA